MSGTNTFSVDEYLSGAIDKTVIVHRPTGSLRWDPKGVSVIGTQLFEKGKHVFERYTDLSVIVTEI